MPDPTRDLLRCPRCGAGNPSTARWCGQCLARFDGEPAERDPSSSTSDRSPVTRAGASLVWTCTVCDAKNSLDADACGTCGTAFVSMLARRDPKPVRVSSSGRAIALSAVLPGLGHWALGRAGPALSRAVLYVWTFGLSILLLARPPVAGRAGVRAVGALFVVAAVGVWMTSMIETMRLAEGDERPLLPPHALTWVTAGLSIALILGLLGAAIGGAGAS